MAEGCIALGVLVGLIIGMAWERARVAVAADRLAQPALPPATARQVRCDRRERIADISVAMARPTRELPLPLPLPSLHDFDNEETYR